VAEVDLLGWVAHPGLRHADHSALALVAGPGEQMSAFPGRVNGGAFAATHAVHPGLPVATVPAVPDTVPPDGAFRVTAGTNGVVRLSWTSGVCITGPLAAAAMDAVNVVNGDRRAPLLVDMSGTDTPTREARMQFGRPSAASRIALLGASPVDRVRASIALVPQELGYPVPTRFFTSEDTALAWLLDTVRRVLRRADGRHGDRFRRSSDRLQPGDGRAAR
jgi:hypothetical protein